MPTPCARTPICIRLARLIATVGPAGYAPVAPGTAGTVVAVPIVWALAELPLWAYSAAAVGLVLLSIAAAHVADRSWQTHDSQRIVVDEVAGYFVTMAPVPKGDLLLLAAGFVLFRVLDTVKPPLARWVDRRMPGGPGVVLDDVIAGLYGAVILWVLWRFLPWL